jgi:hypothetical protein
MRAAGVLNVYDRDDFLRPETSVTRETKGDAPTP